MKGSRTTATLWSITQNKAGVVTVVRPDGSWFDDADDIEQAVGIVQSQGYRGDVTVTEADGYSYRRRA